MDGKIADMDGKIDKIKKIESIKQYQEILELKQLIVIDCYATWCGPCNMISPVVEQLAEKHTTVYFCKVDVDEATDVAGELGVRAMPTFILFKNGAKVDEVVGANANRLKAAIEANKDPEES